MATTPALWKDLTRVNTTDNGAQQIYAQVAPLQNGGYIVVWVDTSQFHNPDGLAIVGQVYSALGEKVGGEVYLGHGDVGHESEPAVTTLSNGNVAVAFAYTGPSDGISVRIFDPTLNFVREDSIASAHTANPALTALADGAYAVSYTRASGLDVAALVVTADGAVGDPSDVDFGDSSEVVTLSNGDFVIVWSEGVPGAVLFKVYAATGDFVGGGSIVGGVDRTLPEVAALKGGGFVVAWSDGDIDGSGTGIGAAVYGNDGVLVSGGSSFEGIHVNTTVSGEQNDASVTALADGGFVIAWEDDNAGVARGQRFDASGNKVGSEFVLSNSVTLGSTEAPIRMTLLSDGRVAFVGNQLVSGPPDSGNYDILTSIWDPRDAPSGGTDGADTLTGVPTGGSISGLGGNDTLVGLGGPDTLDGGAGADAMFGGGGDDSYVVDDGGDQVVEGAGQGLDTVLSAASYALTANVENLTLLGVAAINGTGNELANVIVGNDAANVLAGGPGSDSLTGGLGADSFVFNTALDAASNVDAILDFSHADDTILLDNAIFKKLKKEGELKKKYFEVGKKADDKDDFIVYNKKTGELSYDKNGDHKGGATAFAQLEDHLKIKADDFFII